MAVLSQSLDVVYQRYSDLALHLPQVTCNFGHHAVTERCTAPYSHQSDTQIVQPAL